MKICVIGGGGWGKNHINTLNKLMEISCADSLGHPNNIVRDKPFIWRAMDWSKH